MNNRKLLLYRLFSVIKAFSLVELMIVVAISAAISAIAIPNYKDYINKAKVTEMISIVDPCQTQIYQYFIKNGGFPDGTTTPVTCQGQTIKVAAVPATTDTAIKGKIHAAYQQTASYAQFILINEDLKPSSGTPYNLYVRLTINPTTGDISFSCGYPASASNAMPVSYMPPNCTATMS